MPASPIQEYFLTSAIYIEPLKFLCTLLKLLVQCGQDLCLFSHPRPARRLHSDSKHNICLCLKGNLDIILPDLFILQTEFQRGTNFS